MKRSSVLQSLLPGVLTCVGMLAAPQTAAGQYLGNNFHGDFGVNSGTQAAPGVTVSWHPSSVRVPYALQGVDRSYDYRTRRSVEQVSASSNSYCGRA